MGKSDRVTWLQSSRYIFRLKAPTALIFTSHKTRENQLSFDIKFVYDRHGTYTHTFKVKHVLVCFDFDSKVGQPRWPPAGFYHALFLPAVRLTCTWVHDVFGTTRKKRKQAFWWCMTTLWSRPVHVVGSLSLSNLFVCCFWFLFFPSSFAVTGSHHALFLPAVRLTCTWVHHVFGTTRKKRKQAFWWCMTTLWSRPVHVVGSLSLSKLLFFLRQRCAKTAALDANLLQTFVSYNR